MGHSKGIRIELNPPIKSDEVPGYYAKVEPLLMRTSLVSLTSHHANGLTGFERSLNLIKYIRSVREDPIDILVHLTCRDVDRASLLSKLQQLEGENVSRLLLLSGENYIGSTSSDTEFKNSTELLEEIVSRKFNTRFESLAIAGFPGGNRLSSNNNLEEYARLASRLQTGAIDTIYTQCIFDYEEFDKFAGTVKRHLESDIDIIPSVALFKDLKSLERVVRLTRVQNNVANLRSLSESIDEKHARKLCTTYLTNLCKSFLSADHQVNLCLFGQVDLAREILDEIAGRYNDKE